MHIIKRSLYQWRSSALSFFLNSIKQSTKSVPLTPWPWHYYWPCIDLCWHTTWNNLEDRLTKVDKHLVCSYLYLLIYVTVKYILKVTVLKYITRIGQIVTILPWKSTIPWSRLPQKSIELIITGNLQVRFQVCTPFHCWDFAWNRNFNMLTDGWTDDEPTTDIHQS